MLDYFGKAELSTLVASEGGPHVSIFLPTHTSAADAIQDAIRFKNQLRDAETQLAEGWMRGTEVGEFLAPLQRLLHDEAFWAVRQKGLACFLAKDELHIYRLAVSFEEKLSISRDYLIRPMIPAFHRHAHAFVLSLSEHKVGLFEIEDESIHSVSIADLPVSMDATLNYTSVDRGQQSHSGGSTQQGKRTEVFHGHGGKADTHKDDLRHYFRAIDEAIAARLRDSKAPLILACIDAEFPIYREVNSYVEMCSEYLPGNADYLSPHELLQKAMPILRSKAEQQPKQVLQKILDHLHTPVASAKAADVIRAAFQGRVHTLLFDEKATIEGQFDPAIQAAVAYQADKPTEHNPLNSDLVEQTLVQTLRHNGEVYSMVQSEMPEQAPLAALFRY